MNESAIKLLPPQEQIFWANLRVFFMVWRRQLGKSFTLSAKAMSRMMERKRHSVFIVSASVLMGQENILKEVEIWQIMLEHYRKVAERKGLKLTSNGDGLELDDLAELFEASKLEARIWHSRTTSSRTRVVAPNPNTARGFSGDVFGDEIGFWPDFEGVWDAVEPIISRNPEWMMLLATTPPKDDKHTTFDLLTPGEEFAPNAAGNWYKTESGYDVHRVDAYDSALAGVGMYHPRTGEEVTIEEARKLALNKAAFDRNYLLKFAAGGSAAISRVDLLAAMERGADECVGVDVTDTITLPN